MQAASERSPGERAVGAEARDANYNWIFPLDRPTPPYRSIAEIAAAEGKDPVDVMIDLALEKNLKKFFMQTLVNENQDHVLEMMKHPRSVVTFSDSGAHVSQIMDSSLQTHVLSHWVREKEALTLEQAIRLLSFVPAYHWGLKGRGLLREGNFADVIIFDPDRINPQLPELTYDLPAGARRLKQKSDGLLATVVNGQVVLRKNEHTGALPGSFCAAQWRKRKSLSPVRRDSTGESSACNLDGPKPGAGVRVRCSTVPDRSTPLERTPRRA